MSKLEMREAVTVVCVVKSGLDRDSWQSLSRVVAEVWSVFLEQMAMMGPKLEGKR